MKRETKNNNKKNYIRKCISFQCIAHCTHTHFIHKTHIHLHTSRFFWSVVCVSSFFFFFFFLSPLCVRSIWTNTIPEKGIYKNAKRYVNINIHSTRILGIETNFNLCVCVCVIRMNKYYTIKNELNPSRKNTETTSNNNNKNNIWNEKKTMKPNKHII